MVMIVTETQRIVAVFLTSGPPDCMIPETGVPSCFSFRIAI